MKSLKFLKRNIEKHDQFMIQRRLAIESLLKHRIAKPESQTTKILPVAIFAFFAGVIAQRMNDPGSRTGHYFRKGAVLCGSHIEQNLRLLAGIASTLLYSKLTQLLPQLFNENETNIPYD